MMTCAQQWICRSRRVAIHIISIYLYACERKLWTKTSLSSCSTDCLVDTILCGCGIVSFLCELSRGLLVHPVICDDGILLYRVHPPTPAEQALGLQKYISSLQATLIKVTMTVCCVLQVSCSEPGHTDPVELSANECSCCVERMFGYLFRSARMVGFLLALRFLDFKCRTSLASRQCVRAKDLRCVSARLFSSLWHWGLEALFLCSLWVVVCTELRSTNGRGSCWSQTFKRLCGELQLPYI